MAPPDLAVVQVVAVLVAETVGPKVAAKLEVAVWEAGARVVVTLAVPMVAVATVVEAVEVVSVEAAQVVVGSVVVG